MSQQQVWISSEELAIIAGQQNNELAQILLRFIRELENKLNYAEQSATEWLIKADKRQVILDSNAILLAKMIHEGKANLAEPENSIYKLALTDYQTANPQGHI